MKIYIYVELINRKKQIILKLNPNLILTKDIIKQFIPTLGVTQLGSSDVCSITSNENLNALSFLYKEIISNDYGKVLMFKCIGKEKNSLYFYASIDETKDIDNLNFFSTDISKKESNNINKVYKRFIQNINKSVKSALLFSQKFELKNLFKWVLSIFSALLALILEISDKLEGFLGITVAILIVCFTIISSIFNYIEAAKDFENDINNSRLCDGKPVNEIKKDIMNNKTKTYKDFSFLSFSNGEIFMYSDCQNKAFKERSKEIKVSAQVKKHHIATEEAKIALAFVVSNKVRDKKTIFNNSLVGIDSELIFDKRHEVNIKKVNYFDYVSIDEMIYRNIAKGNDPSYYLKGTDVCLNKETGGFRDIEASALTNLVGVNVIVRLNINEKKYYILNMQSLYNDVNQSKLTPSGSGSLDYKDYAKEPNCDFEELLKRGMFRELSEESYIDDKYLKNHKTSFHLLGFSRLMSKAGKPDFFGVLDIYNDYDEREEILNNFNQRQHELICEDGKRNHALESNYMIIVEENDFFDNENEKYLSPQLSYIKYLIKKERLCKKFL